MPEATSKAVPASDGVRAFAQRAHGEQRYGSSPYVTHLDDVARLVDSNDPILVAVAYLHDVLEDTAVRFEQLQERFGDRIAEAVALVTDPEGHDRHTRKAALHARLAKADVLQAAARAALHVKTADRLANVRTCVRDRDTRLAMYRDEHPQFRAATFRAGLCDALWTELDALLEMPRAPKSSS